MRMTIEEEPRALVEGDFAAHAASGRAQVEAMRRGTATYKGVPIKFGYLPKYFSREGFERLRADLEQAWRILVRVIEEYLDKPDYRALFGFPPELEEMILRRPPYRTLLPICRLDIFLNEETGDFQFCECNADGSSAMNENAELYRTYRDTLLCRQMDARYRQHFFELFDSWAREFLRIYGEAAGAGKPHGGPAGGADALPAVAIVDFLEKGSSRAEFDAFRDAFARAGCRACVAEIRDLRYEGGRLMTGEGCPVDAVYRRAVTSDILAHRDEVRPFLQAARDGAAVLIGDFCTQVVHDKILFRVLHDPRTAAFLPAEDRAFIAAHVPYTALLTRDQAARPEVRDRQEQWILKPRDSYGAHGIYPGRLLSREEWLDRLDGRADTDYILQAFVEPWRTENIYFGGQPAPCGGTREGGREGGPAWKTFRNMTGIYLYGGKVAGIYSRASVTPIISVEGDEHEMASVVLEKR